MTLNALHLILIETLVVRDNTHKVCPMDMQSIHFSDNQIRLLENLTLGPMIDQHFFVCLFLLTEL